jgi:HNH endonuclease
MNHSNRKAISTAQRTRLLQEISCICPFCGLELIGSLQIHHIDRNSSNTVDDNLVAICASCHDQLTRQLIPDSEVIWRKRALQNGVHPARSEKSGMNVSGTDNRGGVIAQEFHGKFVFESGRKPVPIILSGSIADNPPQYRYVAYLIKRLTDFRIAGKSFGQKRKGEIHSGGTRNILRNQFDNLPKDLPIEQFDDLVQTLKVKIDDTALGRKNDSRGIPNYHSFEDHGKKIKKRKFSN